MSEQLAPDNRFGLDSGALPQAPDIAALIDVDELVEVEQCAAEFGEAAFG
jgi:hypothetical protein